MSYTPDVRGQCFTGYKKKIESGFYSNTFYKGDNEGVALGCKLVDGAKVGEGLLTKRSSNVICLILTFLPVSKI